MNTIGVSEVRSQLPKLVDQIDAELGRLYISKNGKTKAVLMSSEEFESWIETIASYEDSETMRRSKKLPHLKRKDLITVEELKTKFNHGS